MKIITFSLTVLCFLLLPHLGNSDIDQDKAKCTQPLMAAATCLTFISGGAPTPTMDCCNGFNKVVQEIPECICLLIKDRDDPSLGLHINVTLALSIPQRCRSTTKLAVTDCISLLHLDPNSSEAQMFEQLGGGKSSAAAPSPSPTGSPGRSVAVPNPVAGVNSSSDGGEKKGAFWVGVVVLVSVSMAAVA